MAKRDKKEEKKAADIICSACGAPIPVGENDITQVTCPYCGTVNVLSQEAAELDRILKVRSKARQRDQDADLEYLRKKRQLGGEKGAAGRRETAAASAEKGASRKLQILGRIGMIGFILWCLLLGVALHDEYPAASAVAYVQAFFAIFELVMKKRLYRIGRKKLYVGLLIIMWALTIPFLINVDSPSATQVDREETWPHGTLASLLPGIDSSHCHVYSNSSERFNINVYQYDKDSFSDYVKSCKEKGFSVDPQERDGYYEAYNEDGYKLELNCFDDRLSVQLVEPVKLSKISWPSYMWDGKLPAPASDQGNVTYETETGFNILIGNTSKDDFNTYIDTLLKSGFNKDYNRNGDYFYGKDKEGNRINVTYEGYNSMNVTFYKAEDQK